MDFFQLSQKHPNFMEQFENWFQKKISEIEYLESKKLDLRTSGKQKETISAVLKELEFSLGLKRNSIIRIIYYKIKEKTFTLQDLHSL